jgi:hypothetical protein
VNDQEDTPGAAGAPRGQSIKSAPQGSAGAQDGDKCRVPSGTSIGTEIKDLKGTRDAARKERAKADGILGDRDNRLQVLEGVERDYPATKKAYEVAYDQLVRDAENLKDYLDCEESKLHERLGKKAAGDVSQLVKDRDSRTARLERDVKKAKYKLGQTTSPLEPFNQAIKDRTAVLNEWKNLTATVTAQHAELGKLRDDITKARQDGYYGLAYGLLLMAQNKRNSHGSGPRLVAPADVHREFHTAGEKLAGAQKRLGAAQRKLESDKAALAAATQDLDEHRKSSEARLRVDLMEIKPADDGAPAAADASAATTDTGGN